MPRATRCGAVLRKVLADWLQQGELLGERGKGERRTIRLWETCWWCVDVEDCMRWVILE